MSGHARNTQYLVGINGFILDREKSLQLCSLRKKHKISEIRNIENRARTAASCTTVRIRL